MVLLSIPDSKERRLLKSRSIEGAGWKIEEHSVAGVLLAQRQFVEGIKHVFWKWVSVVERC